MSTSSTQLNDETREILQATTTRFVNHAVERRVEEVVAKSREDEAIGRVFFSLGMVIVLAILAISGGALVWHLLH